MKHHGYSAAGLSLLEKLWENLDTVIERLMAAGPAPDKPETIIDHSGKTDPMGEFAEQHRRWGEDRGEATGLALAIAIITSPYAPNLPGIKDEAMERYWAKVGEDE